MNSGNPYGIKTDGNMKINGSGALYVGATNRAPVFSAGGNISIDGTATKVVAKSTYGCVFLIQTAILASVHLQLLLSVCIQVISAEMHRKFSAVKLLLQAGTSMVIIRKRNTIPIPVCIEAINILPLCRKALLWFPILRPFKRRLRIPIAKLLM